MWNGLVGLFLKMEQNNLYQEINFNVFSRRPFRAHRPRQRHRRSGGRSTASSVRRTAGPRRSIPAPARPSTSSARALRLSRQPGGRHGLLPTSDNGCATRRPDHSLLPLLRQRHHLSELDGQHGRHHRRNLDDDPSARASGPPASGRRRPAPWSEPTSIGPSTSRSSVNGLNY